MKKSLLTIAIVALSVLAFGQKTKGIIKFSTCYHLLINDSQGKSLANITCDGKVFVKKGYRLMFNNEASTITLLDKKNNKIIQRITISQNKNDKYNTKNGSI